MRVPSPSQVNEFFNQLTLNPVTPQAQQACTSDLYHKFYEHGFILSDFDWSEYGHAMHGHRAENSQRVGSQLLMAFDRLSDEEKSTLLAQCQYDDYFKIITAVVRGDRFNDGYLALFVATGTLRMLLNRLASLVKSPVLLAPFEQETQHQIDLEVARRRQEQRLSNAAQNNDSDDFF